MQEEVLKGIIEATEKENIKSEIMIGFYKQMAKKQKDKDKAAQYEVKADQLTQTKEFNVAFLEYAKTL